MMTKPRKHAFMAVENASYFGSMFRLAKALITENNFRVTIHFPRSYPGSESHILQARSIGIHVLADCSPKLGTYVQDAGYSRIKRQARRIRCFEEIYYFSKEYSFVKLLMRSTKEYFKREAVECLILPADNRFHSHYYIKVAREMNIRSIIAPDWFTGEHELIETLGNSKVHQFKGLFALLLRIWIPEYLKKNPYSKRTWLLPIRLSDATLHRIFQIKVPVPWLLHSGNSNVILCESIWAMNFAKKLGIDSSKLHVTGSATHDEMYKINESSQKNSLLRIVAAIPPDMFGSRFGKNLEFLSYQQMLEYWVAKLKSITDAEIVVSLHPSIDPSIREFFGDSGIRISDKGIHAELPGASLFVASISSTIQWAMSLGIPIINFDLYQYGYPDFVEIPIISNVSSKIDFEIALSNASFGHFPKRENSSEIEKYGKLDGLAVTRILKHL